MSGQRQVVLNYGANQLLGSHVIYTAGQNDEMGQLWVRGPGRMRAELPGKDAGTFDATWRGELQLRPHEGKQLVSLLEGGHVQYNQMGTLDADQIWMWLLERTPRDTGASRSAKVRDQGILPHSMLARGNVKIDTEQLSAGTDQMEVWFQPAPVRSLGQNSHFPP